MKLSLISQYRFRLIYIALSLTITILILCDLRYIIVGIIYLLYLIKTHKDIVTIIFIVLVIYLVIYVTQIDKTIEIAAQYEVVVTEVNQTKDYTSFVGKINGQLVNVFLSDKATIIPGDLYRVQGELVYPNEVTVPGNFNYRNYLLSKGIKYQLFVEKYVWIGEEFNIGIFRFKIDNYITQKIPLSKSYVKTFILADRSEFDQETINDINTLGISHLFAVSGLHVGLLVLILRKILESINVKKNLSNILLSFLLVIYVIITAFSPSVVRASLVFILIIVNENMKEKYSNVDILSFVFILSLMFNPLYFYNPGFVLSFIVTFFLLLNYQIINKSKGLNSLFMVGYISFISTIPVVLSMNYQINLLTLIFNIIFILYMTYLILPLSYLTFVFTVFDSVLYILIKMYNALIQVMSRVNIFIVSGSISSIWEVMIYYIIIITYFVNYDNSRLRNRVMFGLIVFMFFTLNSNILQFKKTVNFLDVEGDSTFISDSFDRCNILIDTGEVDEYDSVINYLKHKNIKRIDYLIISHFHSDHYGEMNDIIEEFNVRNIITPDNAEIYYGSQVTCGSLSFFIYDLSLLNQNENNNSIMMSLYIEDKHYLFTGDSEIQREEEFISKYNIDVDYLKVPHHGSSTSSSIDFIQSIRPEEVFIMVYRYNKFNHPDYFVISRYESLDITVHRTDIFGTIEVEYYFGIERKKYNKP